MEIQLQELQINGNYGQKHCGAMDIYVLKSLWKMWITTCRRILLLFLCQLMAGRKTIKNQNNEKIFMNFPKNSVQITEEFLGRNLLTSG